MGGRAPDYYTPAVQERFVMWWHIHLLDLFSRRLLSTAGLLWCGQLFPNFPLYLVPDGRPMTQIGEVNMPPHHRTPLDSRPVGDSSEVIGDDPAEILLCTTGYCFLGLSQRCRFPGLPSRVVVSLVQVPRPRTACLSVFFT